MGTARRNPIVRPRGYYLARENERKHQPATQRKPLKALTLYKLNVQLERWTRFCSEIDVDDAIQSLLEPDPERFKSYFTWIIDQSRQDQITKRSLKGYWGVLCIKYKQETGMPMPKEVCREIALTLDKNSLFIRENNISLKRKPKYRIGVDTFVELMNVLWSTDKLHFAKNKSRLDFWLYELLEGLSGNRPGAMVNGQRKIPSHVSDVHYVPEPDLLKYEDVKLSLLNPKGSEKSEMVLEITFNRTKGGNGREKPVEYIFHCSRSAAVCPVTAFLAKAFAEGAFANNRLTPSNIFDLTSVPSELGQLSLTFKEEILQVPLFRSDDEKTLRSYTSIYKWHRKLGEAAGISEACPPYVVRREFADSIEEGGVSTEQRTLAMAHRSEREFSFYQSGKIKVDLQSLVVGTPTKLGLIRACHQMKRFVDPEFPWKLCSNEIAAVTASSAEYQSLCLKVRETRQTVLDRYGLLKLASGSSEMKVWQNARKIAKTKQRQLLHNALIQRQHIHRVQAPVERIDRLLDGQSALRTHNDTNSGAIDPGDSLRRSIAKLMFLQEDQLPLPDSSPSRATRSALISKLVELSRAPVRQRQKQVVAPCPSETEVEPDDEAEEHGEVKYGTMFTPPSMANDLSNCSTIISSTTEEIPLSMPILADKQSDQSQHCDVFAQPVSLGPSWCLICYFKYTSPDFSLYHRADNMRKHAQRVHFLKTDPLAQRQCPDPACQESMFNDEAHFKNHADRVHGVKFSGLGTYMPKR